MESVSPRERYRYREIAQELRAGIARGEFHLTGRLPSERRLGERFSVQRNTIRQALTLLEREGHIAIHNKRGAFLRTTETPIRDTLLLTLPLGDSPQLNQLSEGVARGARLAGFHLRRADSHHAEGAMLDPVPDPAGLPSNAAGMILWPQNPTDEQALARLNEALPLVLVDRRVLGVSADSVRFDDVAGGRVVTEHLLGAGHRRIAFLTDDVLAETVQHRWQGYVSAHEAAGVPLVPSFSLFLNGIHEPFFSVVLRHMLDRADAPTAFVCSNDVVAFRLLHSLQAEGLRVPDDIAVTGYGNTMPDYLNAMGLTSVEQSFNELGRTAANLLVDRLGASADERSSRPRHVTIPVSLVPRKSSGREAS